MSTAMFLCALTFLLALTLKATAAEASRKPLYTNAGKGVTEIIRPRTAAEPGERADIVKRKLTGAQSHYKPSLKCLIAVFKVDEAPKCLLETLAFCLDPFPENAVKTTLDGVAVNNCFHRICYLVVDECNATDSLHALS
ncbi:hypothetical protein CLF_106350 [Clonorchis sinensis]|uniref:Saposin B-type domain-containing protein n=1 Tax=Clonorchis sinensis TaxID=79923 RepID=G7YF03_CLOSI|nr:hypothetical protein CLF_106350 [Clonorchis sinensis]